MRPSLPPLQHPRPNPKPPEDLHSHLCQHRLTQTYFPVSTTPRQEDFPSITYFPSKLGWNISDLNFPAPAMKGNRISDSSECLRGLGTYSFESMSQFPSPYLLLNTKISESKNAQLGDSRFGVGMPLLSVHVPQIGKPKSDQEGNIMPWKKKNHICFVYLST